MSADNPTYVNLRQQVEAALIDNGGMDFDLMTRTEESEVAEFIMSYIWPDILQMMVSQLTGVQQAYEKDDHGRP